MLPKFLLPETIARENGTGAEMSCEGGALRLTLGITRIVAQESLEVSVWGSANLEDWRCLATFPQKFYCGTYSLYLDLEQHPDVRHLRAQWKMDRWITDARAPLFEFHVWAEQGPMHHRAGA